MPTLAPSDMPVEAAAKMGVAVGDVLGDELDVGVLDEASLEEGGAAVTDAGAVAGAALVAGPGLTPAAIKTGELGWLP